MNLSPNFTLEELSTSEIALRKGLDNRLGEDEIAYLKRLCEELLEPARLLLGVPLHINSGFRSRAVNKAVGGSVMSAHTYGRAADTKPIGLDLLEAFDRLRHSDLPFDQLIQECGPTGWIHIAIAADDIEPRRQALTATGGPGNWKYERVV